MGMIVSVADCRNQNRRDRPTNWTEDSLEYGYVLDRLSDGRWWHMHFGRSGWIYHCDLLACRTDILACVRQFGIGAVTQSSQFIFTLDGEGVELSEAEAKLDFRWNGQGGVLDLAAEASRFQREVMPVLHASPAFQRAVAEVVACRRYLRLVESGKLSKAEPAEPDGRLKGDSDA